MKIARIYPNFQVDLKYTEHYLARELSKLGNSTSFITSNKYLKSWEPYLQTINDAGYYQHDNFDVYRLNSFFPFEKTIIINLFRLYQLLFKSDFDILHLNGVGTFTTMQVLWMHLLFGNRNLPVIISDHTDTRTHKREGIFARLYYSFFKIQLKVLGNRIEKIITFGDVSVEVLSDRFNLPKKKFEIIPLGYDQDNYTFRKSSKNTSSKMVIGYAGKITPSKRVDYLMKILEDLDFKDKLKLIVVGFNEEDHYCQHLKQLANKTHFDIEFRPFANSNELAEFYNYIDLAVYPGGISITTIEASGCGVPVIIYESIEGLEERVKNERGKLFKYENELKSQLKFYLNKYEKNQINNHRIALATKKEYSWEKVSKKYLKTYKELTNE